MLANQHMGHLKSRGEVTHACRTPSVDHCDRSWESFAHSAHLKGPRAPVLRKQIHFGSILIPVTVDDDGYRLSQVIGQTQHPFILCMSHATAKDAAVNMNTQGSF